MATKAKTQPPVPVDEFDGQGGSYEIDPATGIRRLVHRTQPAAPVQTSAPAPVVESTPTLEE